jgi:hypothetical protein
MKPRSGRQKKVIRLDRFILLKKTISMRPVSLEGRFGGSEEGLQGIFEKLVCVEKLVYVEKLVFDWLGIVHAAHG